MERNISVICTDIDKAAAIVKIATLDPDNAAGYFSVPLTSAGSGETDPGAATHWGMSGYFPEEMADLLEQSVEPMIKTFTNENTTFDENLTLVDPVLYRIYEEL